LNNNLLMTILTALLPAFLQLYYIRYISYNVDKIIFADFVILSTFIYALSQVLLSIPGQAFSRFYNTVEDKILFINEFRTYLIFVNILSLFFIVLIWSIYRVRFDLETYVLIYFLFILVNNYSLNQKIFLLNLDRRRFFVLKILEALSKFILPLVAYYYFGSLNSFIVGIALGYSISFLILIFYLKLIPFKFYVNLKNQKKYFKFAYPIILAGIFSWTISSSDRFFIDYYLEARELTIYAVLAQFGGMSLVISTIYGYYVNPIILKKYEENKFEAYQDVKRYILVLICLLCTSFFIFIFIPKHLFYFILDPNVIGDEYYYDVLIVLVTSTFFSILQTAMSIVYTMEKKLFEYAIIFCLSAIINLFLNLFVENYGIMAAAISTLISYLFFSLIMLIRVKNIMPALIESK
jgi:O-antigen/teichoic acid export membrane protein